MKGIKLFLWIALIIVCLVLMLFFILYFLWVNPRTANPLNTPDKIQTLTSIIALVIGTAATVGSAVATLQVASLGLELSKSQDKRDKRIFIDEKVSNAISIYSEIIVAVGDVFTSSISIYQKIPEVSGNKSKEEVKEKIPIKLEMELRNLSNNLDKLNKAIKALAKDDFSNYCFQSYASKLEGKLNNIANKLIELGKSESNVKIEITSLSEIASFIDIASRKIENGDFQQIITAKAYTNYANTEIFNMPYANASVRSFFFSGNLIFNYGETLTHLSKIFSASYGTAILHDLVNSIPSGLEIKESLLNRYSGLLDKDDIMLLEYRPTNIMSNTLKKAITDTESIGDLYCLIGNIK